MPARLVSPRTVIVWESSTQSNENETVSPDVDSVLKSAAQKILADQRLTDLPQLAVSCGPSATAAVRRLLNELAPDLSETLKQSQAILDCFASSKDKEDALAHSPRFCQWTELTLNKQDVVVGARKQVWLFESNRVVRKTAPHGTSRNFTAFYGFQATQESMIDSPLASHPTREDRDVFEAARAAYAGLGGSAWDTTVLNTLHAILLLSVGENQRAAEIMPRPNALSDVEALSFRELVVKNVVTRIPLTSEESLAKRNGLCIELYADLLDHLMSLMNDAMKPREEDSGLNKRFVAGLELSSASFAVSGLDGLLAAYVNDKVNASLETRCGLLDGPASKLVALIEKEIMPLLNHQSSGIKNGSAREFANSLVKVARESEGKLCVVGKCTFSLLHSDGIRRTYDASDALKENRVGGSSSAPLLHARSTLCARFLSETNRFLDLIRAHDTSSITTLHTFSEEPTSSRLKEQCVSLLASQFLTTKPYVLEAQVFARRYSDPTVQQAVALSEEELQVLEAKRLAHVDRVLAPRLQRAFRSFRARRRLHELQEGRRAANELCDSQFFTTQTKDLIEVMLKDASVLSQRDAARLASLATSLVSWKRVMEEAAVLSARDLIEWQEEVHQLLTSASELTLAHRPINDDRLELLTVAFCDALMENLTRSATVAMEDCDRVLLERTEKQAGFCRSVALTLRRLGAVDSAEKMRLLVGSEEEEGSSSRVVSITNTDETAPPLPKPSIATFSSTTSNVVREALTALSRDRVAPGYLEKLLARTAQASKNPKRRNQAEMEIGFNMLELAGSYRLESCPRLTGNASGTSSSTTTTTSSQQNVKNALKKATKFIKSVNNAGAQNAQAMETLLSHATKDLSAPLTKTLPAHLVDQALETFRNIRRYMASNDQFDHNDKSLALEKSQTRDEYGRRVMAATANGDDFHAEIVMQILKQLTPSSRDHAAANEQLSWIETRNYGFELLGIVLSFRAVPEDMLPYVLSWLRVDLGRAKAQNLAEAIYDKYARVRDAGKKTFEERDVVAFESWNMETFKAHQKRFINTTGVRTRPISGFKPKPQTPREVSGLDENNNASLANHPANNNNVIAQAIENVLAQFAKSPPLAPKRRKRDELLDSSLTSEEDDLLRDDPFAATHTKAEVLFDFQDQDGDEDYLTVMKGQVVHVSKVTQDRQWAFATCEDKITEGWVPFKFIQAWREE